MATATKTKLKKANLYAPIYLPQLNIRMRGLLKFKKNFSPQIELIPMGKLVDLQVDQISC